MITPAIDTTIHSPIRLQICALLSNVKELEFKVLREQLEISDSVLSKHIKQLNDAGYIVINKRTESGRQYTWISLNGSGVKAYKAHVTALKKIIG